MCVCNPIVRTPFCGKPGCEWPEAKRPAAPEATDPQATPHGHGPIILPLVIADLEARSQLGQVKYGEMLRANNGRDALTDAYQEALDQVMYLRQSIEERRAVKMREEEDRRLFPHGRIVAFNPDGRPLATYNVDTFEVTRRPE